MSGCVPRVGAPVLVAYATFSAQPKGDARVGWLPGSAAASSARSSAALPARETGLLSLCEATPAAEAAAGRSAPRACGRGP